MFSDGMVKCVGVVFTILHEVLALLHGDVVGRSDRTVEDDGRHSRCIRRGLQGTMSARHKILLSNPQTLVLAPVILQSDQPYGQKPSWCGREMQ